MQVTRTVHGSVQFLVFFTTVLQVTAKHSMVNMNDMHKDIFTSLLESVHDETKYSLMNMKLIQAQVYPKNISTPKELTTNTTRI